MTGFFAVCGMFAGGTIGGVIGVTLGLAFGDLELGSLDAAMFILGGIAAGAVVGAYLAVELAA